MYHLRRSAISSVRHSWFSVLKSENGLRSFMEHESARFTGFASFSSSITEKAGVELSAKMLSKVLKSDFAGLATAGSNRISKDVLGANGIPPALRRQYTRGYIVNFQSPFQHLESLVANASTHSSARHYASRASEESTEKSSETRKDISTVEDPFDAPTYNIPEKPVTFAEGASYSVIILAGLGIAAAAAYAVFKELIFEPKEYKIFNKALKRIQDDGQVRVRIGSPITGYGQESRNRAARQRIPNRVYTDEFGVEHVEVNFYVRGPHGAGKVFAEMFKDKEDKQWKFTYLIVEITSPSRAQLMLESYIPGPASAPAQKM